MRPTLLATALCHILVAEASAQHDAHRLFSLVDPLPGDRRFGEAAALAGDVDRDGHVDVIVGSPALNAGRAYVFSGRTGALIHNLSGSASTWFGYSVSGAGDVDRDGHADVVVGDPAAQKVVVFSGRTGGSIWTLVAQGPPQFRRFGYAVADAGDVNRDGHADILVGAPSASTFAGEAIVFSGRDGTVIHTLRGDWTGDYLGLAVDGVGDTNGDGYPDVAAGAPFAGLGQSNYQKGMVRVYSGRDGSVLHTIIGTATNELLGFCVGRGGDVDRDGSPDVVVGAIGARRVDVYSGRSGQRIQSFTGPPNEWFGASCAGAGDIDGDGHADFIGAVSYDNVPSSPGLSRVISGRTGQVLMTLRGHKLSGGGDVNGDGYPDIIAGSWEQKGVCFVYSGKALSLRSDVHEIALPAGGTQNLALEAGSAHANRSYWIVGSMTGVKPGITLQGVHIPLNPDLYTDLLLTNVNAPGLTRFRGVLDANGAATAAIQIPSSLPPGSVTLNHAFVVYTGGAFHMASNAVPLGLR